MTNIARRLFIAKLMAVVATPFGALAQTAKKATGPSANFSYDDVVDRARTLAKSAYNPNTATISQELEATSFDAWRQIRFRDSVDLLADASKKFKLQIFHLGHLFKRAIQLNLVTDKVAQALPYTEKYFDYGKLKFEKPLPPDLGYAGFRLHYPLNSVTRSDELISFLGATYFRFLGRDQSYGLSARGLAIGSGNLDNNEEFPFFREFWVETPEAGSNKITVHALLDTPSLSGAYKFDIYPQQETEIVITATLFARRTVNRIGMAPLTSMFFLGENDRHLNDRNKYDEFRPELHDSDGLMIHTAENEWIWRPLKNPLIQEVQRFNVRNPKGFGLVQRDRQFDHYVDIELNYEDRPTYWIQPTHDWGNGVIELIELATKDETADNIVCAFVPDAPLEPGQSFTFSYSIRSLNAGKCPHTLGFAHDTYSAPAVALGSGEEHVELRRRFIVDFTGGNLDYYLKDPSLVRVVASARTAKIIRTFLVPNPKTNGFRAMIDVQFEKDQVGVVDAVLKCDDKTLTETWNYGWRFYNF